LDSAQNTFHWHLDRINPRTAGIEISREHDVGDAGDRSELLLQLVAVEQVRADAFHARGQRRRAARSPIDLRTVEGGPILGGGAAAHPVDTCNQDDVLRGHRFSFLVRRRSAAASG
jgi:hypothetical protein